MFTNLSCHSRAVLQQRCCRHVVRSGSPGLLRLNETHCSCGTKLRQCPPANDNQVRSLSASSGWSLCNNSRMQRSVETPLEHRRQFLDRKTVAFHMSEIEPQPQASTNDDSKFTECRPKYDSDLIVVLDMDECLIHSEFFSNPSQASILAHQVARSQRRNNWEDEEGQPNEVDSFRFHLLDDDNSMVHVNKRPFLDEFLNAVSSKYETHVFTAGSELYAKPLLDILDRDGTKFAKRWYRQDCTFDPRTGGYVKDLKSLPLGTKQQQSDDEWNYNPYHVQQPDLKRVVLVDNNPLSFLANPSKGILVSSFFDDANDDALPLVMELLEELDSMDDVRPALDERFGMKDVLSEILGISTAGSLDDVGCGEEVEQQQHAVAF